MRITLHPTESPAMQDFYFGEKFLGRAVLDVSGFWYSDLVPGWMESHRHREIADLLDKLNAPLEKELESYFAALPKEIDRTVQDGDTPF